MHKRSLFILTMGLSLTFILISLAFAADETLTITTYYPSPYGSYNELQLYPHSSPVTTCNATTRGTMYYDSDDGQIHVCDGASWPSIGGGGGWSLTGNAGTTAGTNFIGTTDAVDWVIKTNNTERMRVASAGNVGIGTTNPTDGKLVVYGSSAVLSLQNNNGNAGTGGVLRFGHDQAGSMLPVAEIRSSLTNGAGAGNRAGHLTFFTSTAGTLSERVRITDAGYVGIGMLIPTSKLYVSGSSGTSGAISINTNGQSQLELLKNGVQKWAVVSTDNYPSGDNFGLYNFSRSSIPFFITASNDNVGIGTVSPLDKLHIDAGTSGRPVVRFSGGGVSNTWHIGRATSENTFVIAETNIATDLVIKGSTGYVGIGTTSPGARLHVAGNAITAAIITAYDGASYYSDWPVGWGGGLATWDICVSSMRYSGLSIRSDERLKKDITPIDATAINRLMKLRPVVYRWKDSGRLGNGIHYGFIAQDVEKVFPELVSESGDEEKIKSTSSEELIAILTKAVQEMKAENDALKARIEALETW